MRKSVIVVTSALGALVLLIVAFAVFLRFVPV